MISKLNYLIGVSLKRKIKSKWFIVVNILLALVIVGVINIDSIITYFGGDFNEKQLIYIIDNTEESFSLFSEQLKIVEKGFKQSDVSSYKLKKYDKGLK